MEIQGMVGDIRTVLLCTSILRSCWQLKWRLCRHNAGTQLCGALQALWTSPFSPNTQRICSVHLCNSDWALDITSPTKPRGYPSLTGDSVSAVCTNNPCSFLNKNFGRPICDPKFKFYPQNIQWCPSESLGWFHSCLFIEVAGCPFTWYQTIFTVLNCQEEQV